MKTCATCRAFDVKTSTCRMNPPQRGTVSVPIPGTENQLYNRVPVPVWPPVTSGDWCTKYSDKREDVV